MASKNIIFKSNNPWYSSVGSLYEDDIINWILLNPDKWQTINDFLSNHYNIYSKNTDNGLIKSLIDTDSDTKNYQDDINRSFGFVNTKGISSGVTGQRYSANADPRSGDNSGKSWSSDGLYGAYTDDRRLFGRSGDYDDLQLNKINERLSQANLELYLDPTTNYYMLKSKSPAATKGDDKSVLPTEGDKNTGTKVGGTDVKPAGTTSTNWLTLYPKQKSKYPGWSDWLPLTAKKITDDLAAIHTGNLERKKVFPKFEVPREYAEVTNAYAQRQLLEKQKQEVLARAGYSPTSDLTLNLNARAKGELLAGEISDKQTALKAKEFAETTKLVLDVANKNNMYQTNVANLNMKSNAAAMNSIIDSRIKQNERLASNLGTYAIDMYANYGEYLKTKRLNENARKRQEALYKFSKARTEAYKPYYDLLDNPGSWRELDNFRTALSDEGALSSLTEDQKRVWNEAAVSGNYTSPEFVNLLITLLKSGTSPAAQKYRALYNQELQTLQQRAEYYNTQAEADLYNTLSSIDTYATNQWGRSLGSRVKKSVLSEKQGGKVEDRFSKLERIRQRELQSVRENALKRNKMISDSLDKQLDRISKEELALLRAIFK